MKKLVALSGYCWVFTALALAVLCGISMYAIKQPDSQSAIWILGTIFTLLLIIVIWYMPMAITLDEDSLRVQRPLRIKTIPLSEIENIKMCPPSMGEKTICGSYGFMGHYGWFSEKDLGKYFAYYGKSSDCFLVTLKDGKKYMLGCQDAPEVVETVKLMLGRS